MQFKLMLVPVDGGSGEEALNRFLRSHRVVDIERRLIEYAGVHHWAFALQYLLGTPSDRETHGRRPRIDYRDVLSDDEFARFAGLRELRKTIAEQDAVPVYTVATNEQLAQMARMPTPSLTELRKIDGIGAAKAAKYGEQFVTCLRDANGEPKARPDESAPEE